MRVETLYYVIRQEDVKAITGRKNKPIGLRRRGLNSNWRTACQNVQFRKGFGIEKRSKPFICSVYYDPKCCMETEKLKNDISRRSPRFNEKFELSTDLEEYLQINRNRR